MQQGGWDKGQGDRPGHRKEITRVNVQLLQWMAPSCVHEKYYGSHNLFPWLRAFANESEQLKKNNKIKSRVLEDAGKGKCAILALPTLDGNSAGFESLARKLTARTMESRFAGASCLCGVNALKIHEQHSCCHSEAGPFRWYLFDLHNLRGMLGETPGALVRATCWASVLWCRLAAWSQVSVNTKNYDCLEGGFCL